MTSPVSAAAAGPASPGEVVGVLLAAGKSRRFGSPKLRARLSDGTPMGVASARKLRSAVDRVIVVLAEGDEGLRDLFADEGFDAFVHAPADGGMGESLACGVAAAPLAAAWVVALGDMPFIRPQTVRSIARAMGEGAWIAVPTLDGRRGHPVGFSAGLRDELLRLEGDRGARGVVDRHVERVRWITCDDPGIEFDVDTPERLAGSA